MLLLAPGLGGVTHMLVAGHVEKKVERIRSSDGLYQGIADRVQPLDPRAYLVRRTWLVHHLSVLASTRLPVAIG